SHHHLQPQFSVFILPFLVLKSTFLFGLFGLCRWLCLLSIAGFDTFSRDQALACQIGSSRSLQ
ncbi:unnamed protein product, partial [Prunus brigantina]